MFENILPALVLYPAGIALLSTSWCFKSHYPVRTHCKVSKKEISMFVTDVPIHSPLHVPIRHYVTIFVFIMFPKSLPVITYRKVLTSNQEVCDDQGNVPIYSSPIWIQTLSGALLGNMPIYRWLQENCVMSGEGSASSKWSLISPITFMYTVTLSEEPLLSGWSLLSMGGFLSEILNIFPELPLLSAEAVYRGTVNNFRTVFVMTSWWLLLSIIEISAKNRADIVILLLCVVVEGQMSN